MLQSILGAIAFCLDGLSGVIIAASAGFATVPTSVLFFVSAIGMTAFGQVAPLSIQSEVVLFIGQFTKERRERLSIGFFSGILMTVLGCLGVSAVLVDFVGETIMAGIMAGVGIMLVKIALEIAKGSPIPGYIGMTVSVVTYILTQNLIYALTLSVVIASVIWNVLRKRKPEMVNIPKIDEEHERFRFVKPVFNAKVCRGTLAIATIMLGSVISEGTISNQIAGRANNLDPLAAYMGVAGVISSLFGGAPGGLIISGTTAAPYPIFSGVLFCVLTGLIVVFKLVPKLMHYLAPEGMAGFLFALGALVIIPDNALTALSGQPLVAALTMMVTAFIDPFLGMVAGVLLQLLLGFMGVVS